jgi:hypothetical protein
MDNEQPLGGAVTFSYDDTYTTGRNAFSLLRHVGRDAAGAAATALVPFLKDTQRVAKAVSRQGHLK